MPARRMRVELFDGDGNKYSISFEGQITRDKALRLLDLVELLGGVPPGNVNSDTASALASTELSKFDKVRAVVQKHFPLVWFSSRELQSVFETELKEPITLSTVATYLARMAAKGLVLKSGPPNSLRYKAATNTPRAALEQRLG
jgi:hypothetical protein